MRRGTFSAAGALACALVLGACSLARQESAKDAAAAGGRRLASAERAAQAGDDAAALARAGWLRYLVASDAPGALERFQRALAAGQDPEGHALALAGLAEIHEDRLETLVAARAWVRALSLLPRGPLAE